MKKNLLAFRGKGFDFAIGNYFAIVLLNRLSIYMRYFDKICNACLW